MKQGLLMELLPVLLQDHKEDFKSMSSQKTKIFLFILLLISFSLTCPKPTHAIIGTGIFDWADSVLNALDSFDQAILSFLLKLVIFAFLSAGFAVLSAYLLEWAVDLPLYLNNPAVLAGFHFIVGLVNLFFVLAIVFIALAYILRIETFQLKKVFARLILAILLVNFSLLIVGAFVDIAQFFMNTLLSAYGKDFANTALLPLRGSLGAITNVIIATITGYVASAFTVFGAPFSLVYLGLMFWQGNLLGNVFSIVVLILFNLVMGAIFFVFTVLFIIRIAALWILGIFAPLGVFCFVFDQTKKYGWEWLKATFQWATLGIVAFFLLGLILSIFSAAFLSRPGNIDISPIAGVPSFQLPPSIYNYLFLIIFLIVAFYGSLRYVPVGAQEVIGVMKAQLKALGGVAGITSLMKKGVGGVARRVVPEKVRRKAEQLATAPGLPTREEFEKMSRREKLKRLVISPYAKRALGRAITSVTVKADESVYTETKKKFKGKDVQTKVEWFHKESDFVKKAAILASLIEEKQLKDAMDKARFGTNALQYSGAELNAALRKLVRMGKEDEWKAMLRAFKDKKDEFYNILREEKTLTEKDLSKKGYKNITEYIAGETKKADQIKQLNKDWFDDDEFADAIHKFWGGHQVGEAAKAFGRKFTDTFNAHAKPLDWYYEIDPSTGKMRNAQLPRYLASTGAMNAGLYPIEGGEDRKKLNELFRKGLEKEKAWTSAPPSFEEVEKEEKKELPSTPPRGSRGLGGRKPPRGSRGLGGGKPPRGSRG
ncbi:MAG TPA: hypothetical protein ENF31_00130, partial [bacterium]|nr:hypothetical protein [bacterium]